MRAALLCLLLTACLPANPELSPQERAVGKAVAQAWAASGLPQPTLGRYDVSTFHVRVASGQEFYQLCHRAEVDAFGCASWKSTDALVFYREQPVVVIASWWRSEPAILVHELLHSYSTAAGVGPNAFDVGDGGHTNKSVWMDVGGPTSVQARALAILAGSEK